MSGWSGSGAAPLDPAALADPATELAESRVRQAARTDCSPDTLRDLASDPELIVRATVALNRNSGPEIDRILVADADERVRALLAGRIASLLPGLDAPGQEDAAEHVHSTLAALAADQATRVRAAIAEEIATMPDAPRDLVIHLARDTASEVSDQIIRLSPVLSDSDLLALLALPRTPATATSIANRTQLSATVADAIVQRADAPTIRALLANQSACIREATLDALVGRAPNHVDWHAPLVRRPYLSTHAIRALSEFIAADLLRVLASRGDLDEHELGLIRRRLSDGREIDDQSLMQQAMRLQLSGQLTEAAVEVAITNGDARRVLAYVALASDVSLRAIDRIVETRSAKALVSLVWRAGFTMSLANAIQVMLAEFGPEDILVPSASGEFPISEAEMVWQIELAADMEPTS